MDKTTRIHELIHEIRETEPDTILKRFVVASTMERPEREAIEIGLRGLEDHDWLTVVCAEGTCQFTQLGQTVDIVIIPTTE